ncbi:hypothetical protein N9L68_03090 [bacterium]|nr:hypothetical protein [bacterium]
MAMPWRTPLDRFSFGSPARTLGRMTYAGLPRGSRGSAMTTWQQGTSAIRAAPRVAGVGDYDLATRYFCYPASKSSLRILAQPGIKVRLTRNFDKARGFVNRAKGTLC